MEVEGAEARVPYDYLDNVQGGKMAAWEVCHIAFESSKIKGKVYFWWEARRAIPQGEVIIAKSTKFLHPGNEGGFMSGFFSSRDSIGRDSEVFLSRRRKAHASIVAELAASGWEPAGTHGDGLVSAMKRAKS